MTTVITRATTSTQQTPLHFYRFVYSCRVTEHFSAITPTQRDHCLFSAVGLCPQLLYITSSERLLCSTAPAVGKLITLLHQLLLGDAQRNKTRLTSGQWCCPSRANWNKSRHQISGKQRTNIAELQRRPRRRVCKQFAVFSLSLHRLTACSVSPGVHNSVC